jgi:xanthine dehydrogenase accessory factor
MNVFVGRPVAVVLGAGDVGSAVALALHRAGLAVVLCDEPDPSWSRRGMAFANAWYLGSAELDGDAAMFCASVKSIPSVLDRHRLIAATTWPWRGVARALTTAALVDARMRKRRDGDDLRTEVPAGLTTIGLGPGFVAGGNVDIAIETAWGDRLGAVIASGPTLPFAGEPRPIGGAGRERFVYAPVAGRFTTDRRIAGRVLKGEVIGAIGTSAIAAPLDGVLRGLSARGARIAEGAKVVEVDPRGDPALCYGPGPRPLAVARGVVTALAERGVSIAAG